MSHELRTPLTAVLGLSEALGSGVYGELNEKQASRLAMIHQSGEKLLYIINDILDFSKLESGSFDLQPELTSVTAVCMPAVQAIQPAAEKKQLLVSTTLDMAINELVVDPRRLRQMLSKLLSNAVKFTPPGGKVGLKVTRVNDEAQLTPVVRFTVWDTGIGIAEDQLDQLFQPFVQIDGALSRRYEGTGLGLAFVSRLCEQMGGSVGVESRLGQGSRFWIDLPTGLPSGEAEQPNHAGSALPPHLHVLVVEDSPTNQALVCDFLRSLGCRVDSAANGLEAIQLAGENPPDLVLMDIQMPVMDGLEAIQRLRALPQFNRLPIIALTALVMPGDREQCLKAGASDYLSKPIQLDKLREAIARVL
ncbi:MAG: response regulator [Chloroflexota bacterium]